MFEKIPSKIKKIEIFLGYHTDERPLVVINKALGFLNK